MSIQYTTFDRDLLRPQTEEPQERYYKRRHLSPCQLGHNNQPIQESIHTMIEQLAQRSALMCSSPERHTF